MTPLAARTHTSQNTFCLPPIHNKSNTFPKLKLFLRLWHVFHKPSSRRALITHAEQAHQNIWRPNRLATMSPLVGAWHSQHIYVSSELWTRSPLWPALLVLAIVFCCRMQNGGHATATTCAAKSVIGLSSAARPWPTTTFGRKDLPHDRASPMRLRRASKWSDRCSDHCAPLTGR